MHTRTRQLSVVALAATMAIAMAGCGAAQTAGPASIDGKPVSGGTLVFAQQVEPSCFDPVQFGDMNQALFAAQVLDSLVSQDADGNVQPWLAESWDISEDGLVYTFHLKEGVTFTDGTPFDAAAVVANWDYIKAPDGGAGGSASNYIAPVASYRAVDEQTFEATLSAPWTPFLEQIAQSFVGVQSPTALARGAAANCKDIVGTGPFSISSYTPGEQVVFERNENYTSAPPFTENQTAPYIEDVIWRFIPDETSRFAATSSGQVDASDGLSPVNQLAAQNDSRLAVSFHDYPGFPFGITFNVQKEPFDDLRVRQAFNYATDVQAGLDSILFGLWERPGVISNTTPFAAPDLAETYSFDLDRANDLLDEAGWDERDSDGFRVKDGKRLTVDFSYATTAIAFPAYLEDFFIQVQATTKEAGFEVNLDRADTLQEWSDDLTAGDHEIFLYKYTLNSADIMRLLWGQENTGSRRNPGGIDDAELTALVNQAAQVLGVEERRDLYREAQQRFVDQAYGNTFFQESVRIVSNPEAVQGISHEPSLGMVNLRDAWVTK